MRLPTIERGEHLGDRVLYKIVRVVSGHPMPDVVRRCAIARRSSAGRSTI